MCVRQLGIELNRLEQLDTRRAAVSKLKDPLDYVFPAAVPEDEAMLNALWGELQDVVRNLRDYFVATALGETKYKKMVAAHRDELDAAFKTRKGEMQVAVEEAVKGVEALGSEAPAREVVAAVKVYLNALQALVVRGCGWVGGWWCVTHWCVRVSSARAQATTSAEGACGSTA